jgi:hypothetical protein
MKFIKLVEILGEGERRTIWLDPSKINVVALHPLGLQVYLGSKFSLIVDCSVMDLNIWLTKSQFETALPLETRD